MTAASLAGGLGTLLDGVTVGVAPFRRLAGMVGIFVGGVLEIGEFLRFMRKALSYTIRVPPGVVEYSVPPGVDE